ncbi:MAG TPA: (d)CMP kinase [Acidimicrobiales bacterium]|nr:(d)CMP kinase [Acidimicrobiales bacterium]
MSGPVVAIDGPAGSGKSTVARALAERLGWAFLDTGAMYRAVTVEALSLGIDPHNTHAVAEVARAAVVATRPRVSVNGRDVQDEIRTALVNEAVSVVAANAAVRASMVERQRAWAAAEPVGTVVEGRDITTVVFPDATLKVYLTATAEVRAARRGDESPESIARRDAIDSGRAASPLTVADDALVVDTTGREVEDVVEEIYECLMDRSS